MFGTILYWLKSPISTKGPEKLMSLNVAVHRAIPFLFEFWMSPDAAKIAATWPQSICPTNRIKGPTKQCRYRTPSFCSEYILNNGRTFGFRLDFHFLYKGSEMSNGFKKSRYKRGSEFFFVLSAFRCISLTKNVVKEQSEKVKFLDFEICLLPQVKQFPAPPPV